MEYAYGIQAETVRDRMEAGGRHRTRLLHALLIRAGYAKDGATPSAASVDPMVRRLVLKRMTISLLHLSGSGRGC